MKWNPIAATCIVAAIVLGSVATAITIYTHHHDPAPLARHQLLMNYPEKKGSTVDVSHLAPNVLPPTNSWLSGAVLQKTPDAVYPMPLSFLPSNTGFELNLPTIQATASLITGEHAADVSATIASADHFLLTRDDKISATLSYMQGKTVLGTLTIAEGSPFVFYHAQTDSHLSLANVGATKKSSDDYIRFTIGAHDYAVATYSGAHITKNGSSLTITTPKGSLATFYGLPSGTGDDQLHALAGNELLSVSTTSAVTSSAATTTFTYTTAKKAPTVFVPMSYSHQLKPGPTLGSYDSLYGPMPVSNGTSFTLSTPRVTASNKLDLSHLSDADKNQIIASLHQDIATTKITSQDSYDAGKQLARAANLLQVAEQFGQTADAKQLMSILNNAFATRLTPSYFYYDPELHGIAAATKAFGSEDFNDHHFHYGYFIYAASILGQYDKSFLTKYEPAVNLLVADIASYQQSSDFPLERYYDAYAQHSWAAGLAPFADGNNQESSSEAINAWNAVALWGSLIKNNELTETAQWMLAGESATAEAAWRSPTATLQASYLKAYTSPVSSLNFGGKRTDSTFFSSEPSAKLGIQLIPMNPGMVSFKADGDQIKKITSASITGDNFNVPLGDYVLMYLALDDPAKARSLLAHQTMIDDGNSKTYLEAWIFAQADA